MNIWTRWRLFVPTARAMPISVFRSAASITKIMMMSRTPAAMEKSPRTRKNVIMPLPNSSAKLTLSCFVSSTLSRSPWLSMAASSFFVTVPLKGRESRTPPLLEMAMTSTCPSRPKAR